MDPSNHVDNAGQSTSNETEHPAQFTNTPSTTPSSALQPDQSTNATAATPTIPQQIYAQIHTSPGGDLNDPPTAPTSATFPDTNPNPSVRYLTTHLCLLRAQIILLENMQARMLRHPQPHSHVILNNIRTHLLRDNFFDATALTSEVHPRSPPTPTRGPYLVALFARLLMVLSERGHVLTPAQNAERVEVRNLCFDQPFFDRGVGNEAWAGATLRRFTDDEGIGME